MEYALYHSLPLRQQYDDVVECCSIGKGHDGNSHIRIDSFILFWKSVFLPFECMVDFAFFWKKFCIWHEY